MEDSGIGIKEADQSHLFTSFGIVDNIENQNINPTGAGLYLNISNKLVQMMKYDGTVGL